ncbi:hypothetical protein [Clostridium sp. B9]|uniref:hypothetical protein n=1 Tax=Clostridium sp. B9 TaxID=3423224 RepID=UPI003D2F007B
MTVIKETGKILLVYFLSTIAYSIGIVATSDEIDFTTYSELKKYWIALIFFSIVFLLLIRLLKVKFETVVIFLVIIMFLLLFLIVNKGFFETYIGSTPDNLKFPIMSVIAIYTTMPFQGIIWTLVGFDMVKITEVIVPLYVTLLGFLSYFIINIKKNNVG